MSPLSKCLESADSPEGRRRVADYLKSRPFPHYETASGHPGLLIRIDENGTRTPGRFANRRFGRSGTFFTAELTGKREQKAIRF
jgi:hypothetical protein